MPNRLSPFRTDAPVPNGLMVLAGILCVFPPLMVLIPASIYLPDSTWLDRIELFVYVGWVFGLVAMIPTLIAAHFANRAGVNGWLLTLGGGFLIGSFVGLILDGGYHSDFAFLASFLGLAYAAGFWAMAHGFAALRDRGAPA